jgi:gamma-glutamyl hydrolase
MYILYMFFLSRVKRGTDMTTYMRKVGIITMPSSNSDVFINESNVRWFTERGIDVVPIPFKTRVPERYAAKVHGLYLQGGPIYDPQYMKTAKALIESAVRRNKMGEYFPVWGTCHGMQTLIMVLGGMALNGSELATTDSEYPHTVSLSISPSSWFNSRMTKLFTPEFRRYITDKDEGHILFKHQYAIAPKEFYASRVLPNIFRVISTTLDRDGKTYVSAIEGRQLPFYGVQFHPEILPALEPFRTFFINELMKNTRKLTVRPRKTFHETYKVRKCRTRKTKRYYDTFDDLGCYFFGN